VHGDSEPMKPTSTSKPFNLLRSFSILSLLSIMAISAVSATLLARFLRENLLRGHRWIEAMQAAAADRRLATPYEYETLPHASHSFKASMKRGQLGQRVFDFLFGPPPG